MYRLHMPPETLASEVVRAVCLDLLRADFISWKLDARLVFGLYLRRYTQNERDLSRWPVRPRSQSMEDSADERTIMTSSVARSATGTTSPLGNGSRAHTPAEKQPFPGILLFGPAGCGKGTLGEAIGKLPGVVHCSSGDLIRSAMSESGGCGDRWAAVAKGSLIDDGSLWRLFDSFLASLISNQRPDAPLPLVVVDGIPRCRSQVHELAKRVDVRGVFYLKCLDPQVLLSRLVQRSALESRLDDASRITVETRLRLFNEQTLPLLEEYQPGIIHRFDASQRPQKVLSDVLAILNMLQEDRIEFADRKHPFPQEAPPRAFYRGGSDW
jgi:adenylate kinase